MYLHGERKTSRNYSKVFAVLSLTGDIVAIFLSFFGFFSFTKFSTVNIMEMILILQSETKCLEKKWPWACIKK